MLRQLPKDIETQVQEFLQSYEGYKLEKHLGSDIEWGFQIIGQPKTRGEIRGTTEVYQPKNRTDYIAVTQKFELEETMVTMLGQLSEASEAQLYFELMTEVYRSDCQITINFNLKTPIWFRVGMPVYADALSQDTLAYRINKVHNAAGLLLAFLSRAALNYSKKPVPKQV